MESGSNSNGGNVLKASSLGGKGVPPGGGASGLPRGGILFSSSPIDVREELETRHLGAFALVSSLTVDKSESESLESLSSAVSRDAKSHEEICLGLLVGVLSTSSPERYYRDLSLVARDGLSGVLSHLTHLVLDKWTRLHMGCKSNLLWLTREMIKSNVSGTDSICWNLMRQIAGGDVSRGNLWLADSLLDIFIEHRGWLEKFSFLLASVVYTYLRVIEDHFFLEKLREKEVKFVVSLMRDHFNDVIVIGRDLLRVLQYVAKIKDFEELWSDILYNPKSLAPNFTGITMLMHTRTSRRFLQSRITPEMERKLVFLTSQVRFGTHKRYQEWFQKQYLSTNESQSLRCDLIRFIVGVIHPTNELLCSDIIPRWAVIGWLLTTCTSPVAASNAKLSLFYDWLFFQPDKDNIMNIEPAILVMHHSLRPHPAITATLLDFLCRIIHNFHPGEQEKVRNGIYNSLRQILDKRVLPSLSPLFDNIKVDEELRSMLKDRFGPFINNNVGGGGGESDGDGGMPVHSAAFSDDEEEDDHLIIHQVNEEEEEDADDNHHVPQVGGGGVKRGRSKSKSSSPYPFKKPKLENTEVEEEEPPREEEPLQEEEDSSPPPPHNNDEEEAASPDNEDGELKDVLRKLKEEPSASQLKDNMEVLLRVVSRESLDFEECSSVASILSEVLHEQFEERLGAPSTSLSRPIFIAFRSLSAAPGESSRGALLSVLAELYGLQPRLGYHLLYFLQEDPSVCERKAKAGLYRDLCEAIDAKYSLDICLVNDMRQAMEDDVDLFVSLVPEVFSNFPKVSVGNVDLIYLIVSCVDGRQIQGLVAHLLSKAFLLVRRDASSATLLKASLAWETFEQYALWTLLGAQNLPLEGILPLIPQLDPLQHPEALTFISLHLKPEKPSGELVRVLTAREVLPGDNFVVSTLAHWLLHSGEKLTDILGHQLGKQVSKEKKKRVKNSSSSASGGLSPSAELTLSHLDALRIWVKQSDFLSSKGLTNGLSLAKQGCSEPQRTRFAHLFTSTDPADSEGENDRPKSKSKSNASSSKYNSVSSSAYLSSNHHHKKTVLKVTQQQTASQLSDSSEDELASETAGAASGNLFSSTSSTSSSSSPRGSSSSKRGRGKNPRKRAAGRISYKEAESTEEEEDYSSDSNHAPEEAASSSSSAAAASLLPPVSSKRKNKKKQRLLSPSDSD